MVIYFFCQKRRSGTVNANPNYVHINEFCLWLPYESQDFPIDQAWGEMGQGIMVWEHLHRVLAVDNSPKF